MFTSRLQHPGRGDVLDRQTAAGRHLLGSLQELERGDGGVHHVDRVVAAQRLGQDVVHPSTFQHRARRTTGDHAGTRAGRAQQHHAGGRLTLHRVRDGAADQRDPEEALARFLYALGDRGRHFLALAVADPDHAVAVAHDDQRGEAESPTTLDHLGDAVDRDDPLQVVALVAVAVAAATAAAVVAASAAVAVTARVTTVTAAVCGTLAASRLLRHYAVLPVVI